MKTLTDEVKIQIMDKIIQPFIAQHDLANISADIAITLRYYLISEDFREDKYLFRSDIVLSTALVMDLLTNLQIIYKDWD